MALVEELAKYKIDRIFSSPYPRAAETVQPLAEAIGCAVEIRDDLRERKLCDGIRGDWKQLLERSWRDFGFALPGCESGFECRRRVRACLEEIVRVNAGRTIAVASHGNAIGLFLNSIDPGFGYEQWAGMKNPHVYVVAWLDGNPQAPA